MLLQVRAINNEGNKPHPYYADNKEGDCLGFYYYYSHCNSLVSMSSSSISSSTTRMTQATRKQLKPADSRQTCHSAALRPQHGFSQFDLTDGGRGGERMEGGDTERGENRRLEELWIQR